MTHQIPISGPKIDRETYERSQRSGKAAKRLSAEMKAIRREITAVRAARDAARWTSDPLLIASCNRRRNLELRRRRACEDAAAAKAEATRKALLAAARQARTLGFEVRSSADRTGRISSYYCRRPGAAQLRISDHEIPQTPQRDGQAILSGRPGFDGYPGPELIIDRPRSATWLRRAIVLAAAGRNVPGTD